MRCYVAGPMSGYPAYNHPAFHAAARRIEEAGWTALNPADEDLTFAHDHPGETAVIRAHYYRRDLRLLAQADAIAVLPGWQDSEGAQGEVHVARILGIPILDAETLQPYSETILEEAQRIVYGDREAQYGNPALDFARTGTMWGAILADWAITTQGQDPVPMHLVAACMAALKLSRIVQTPTKRDSWTDLAGYAAAGYRTVEAA